MCKSDKIDLNQTTNVKLILDRRCNMNCIYCIQGKNKGTCNNREDWLPPGKLANLLPKKHEVRVNFFGGEPLLNFEYLEAFAKVYRQRNRLASFSIVTNGYLLTEERVRILNELGVQVTISHDGPCYEITRRATDILITKGLTIAQIDRLGFIATITKENADFYQIWNYFEKFRARYMLKTFPVILNPVRDISGALPEELFIYNDSKFECMLDKVFYDLEQAIIQSDWESWVFKSFKRIIFRLNKQLQNPYEENPCQSINHLVVDTGGNLYRCHTILDKIGEISDLKGKKLDFQVDEECKECSIRWACYACPLMDKQHKKYYCYFQKQVYRRLVRTLESVGRRMNNDY